MSKPKFFRMNSQVMSCGNCGYKLLETDDILNVPSTAISQSYFHQSWQGCLDAQHRADAMIWIRKRKAFVRYV